MKHKTGWGLSLALLCALLAGRVWAHGGGVAQLTNQPLGDYLTTVWLNPSPAKAGIVHLTVALGQDNNPVLNQDVTVQAVAQDSRRTTVSEKATHANSTSRYLYEADLDIPYGGDWLLTISVVGQEGDASFLMPVQADSSGQAFVYGAVGLISVGLLLFIAVRWRRKRG